MIKPVGDEYFMKEALKEAHKALDKDEVPVGAVVVYKDRIIARAHNLTETLNDPTAHAEMQVITAATDAIGGKYLKDCSIYITLEPCIMCAGAIMWSQVSKIVFGAFDEKKGYSSYQTSVFGKSQNISGGVMEKECSELIVGFFVNKRKLKS